MNGETITSTAAMPAATLGDHALLGAAHRLAWTMGLQGGAVSGRRTDRGVASALSRGAARRERARSALLRLAADPAATPAERELARTRAGQLQGQLV